MKRIAWMAGAILSCLFSPANAQQPAPKLEIIASCGPSDGHNYSLEGGVVGPGHGGWSSFSSTKPSGTFRTFLINRNGVMDVVRETEFGMKGQRNQSGHLSYSQNPSIAGSHMAVVRDDDFFNIDTYLFKINEFGEGVLVTNSTSLSELATMSSVAVSKCSSLLAPKAMGEIR